MGSEAPSLHWHYPASTVLRASPTSDAAQSIPRRTLVDRPKNDHHTGSPVLRYRSPCAVPSPSPRRNHTNPVELRSCNMAFPFRTEGRLPLLAFTRLTRRSLPVTARTLAERLSPPFSSKALDRSLPPDRLRLLPGGPTAFQDGSRTHGINTTFPRRTPDAQVLKLAILQVRPGVRRKTSNPGLKDRTPLG